jgi:hypothetical protein
MDLSTNNMRDSCYDPKQLNLIMRKPKGILQFGDSTLTRDKGGIINVQPDQDSKKPDYFHQLHREFEESNARSRSTKVGLKKEIEPKNAQNTSNLMEGPDQSLTHEQRARQNLRLKKDLEKREKVLKQELSAFSSFRRQK